MTTIDIREADNSKVDKIIFATFDGTNEFIANDGATILLKDAGSGSVYICKEDIPNLIKALQKALELWGEV